MSIVRLKNVSKRYDERVVLREVFFRLQEGDRVGLIGKNGTGKTTLLRLVLGLDEPTEGVIEIQQGLRMGYFSQFSSLDGQQSIVQILQGLFSHVHDVERELAAIEAELGQNPDARKLDRLLNQQAELFEEMDRLEGWTYQNRIDTALSRLGFSAAHREMPVSQLSGGWRNRAALAKIVLEAPDLLLMDEPTNYLDLAGLQWLEKWFQKHPGAMIVVSHDRNFLDNVVNRIVEIENHHFHEYPGNFAQYVNEKRSRVRMLENQFEHEEELLAFEAEAIEDRAEAATDPSKSLLRRLADIKKRAEPRPVDRIVTALYERLHVTDRLCQVKGISKGWNGTPVFRDLSFDLNQGERVVIVGPNGCGKTTLVEVLCGRLEPDAGKVSWWGQGVCYYNRILAELDAADTLTHAVNTLPMVAKAPRKQVNALLAMLQFSEMDLKQKLGVLSGGQKARAALAMCLLSGATTLILDEPTNHLDVTSTQVMERALVNFPGAAIAVSHDRFFIDKVATRLLVYQPDGSIRTFNGNWALWQATEVQEQESP